MIKTASRFYELQKSGKKAYDANGNLKQGSEYKSFQNAWGSKNIIVIFNWKDGLLHSDENTPAIQMIVVNKATNETTINASVNL